MKRQSSISSFFSGNKCAKTTEPTHSDANYEEPSIAASVSTSVVSSTVDNSNVETKASGSKSYKFQDSWKKTRFWLNYNAEMQKMYCQVCCDFDQGQKPNSFRDGCTSFRKKIVEDHEKSNTHIKAMSAHNTQITKPSERPLEQIIINMESQDYTQTQCLFKTAYYLVQSCRPYSDFAGLAELQRANGANLSSTYCNDKQARTFIDYIFRSEKETLVEKIQNVDVFSFLSDASTDRGTIDEECVNVRYVDPETKKPVTRFVGLRGLAKSDSDGVFSSIKDVLETDLKQNWKVNLVGCCMDGASVNLGRVSGVAAKFKAEAPHLLIVHCCAHRLELAIKDSMKDVPFYETVDQLLHQIYALYKKSPLSWSSLKQTAQALILPVLKPTKITGTRWMAHHERALKIIQTDWPVLVVHLEQVAITGSGKPENKEKAKSLLKTLTSTKFVMMLNFLLKFFKYLSCLSMTLQTNEITADVVIDRIKSTQMKLTKICDTLDETIRTGINKNELGQCTYHDHVLDKLGGSTSRKASSDRDTLPASAIKTIAQSIVVKTNAKIDKRFENLLHSDNEIMIAFSIFEPAVLPTTESDLLDYGDESVKLLCKQFSALIASKNASEEAILDEWCDLKNLMLKKLASSKKSVKYVDFWSDIIKAKELDLTLILLFVKISLVLPTSSAECERAFSLMKRIKTDWRATLSTESLSALMFINLNCSLTVSEYSPDEAIKAWWAGGKQRRRPRTKPYGPRTKDSNNTMDDHSTDSDGSGGSDSSDTEVDSGTRKKSKKKKHKRKDIERSSGDSDGQVINEDTLHKQNRLPIFPLAGRGDNSPSGVDADSEGQASQSAQESGQAQTPSPNKPLKSVASAEAGASAAHIQDGEDAALAKAGGEASGINLGELHKIQKALEILNLPPSAPKNLEDGARKRYQFWDTQPVPKFDEKVMDNGSIEEDKPRHEVRSEPYSLPHGFQWDTLDINDPLVLKELYTLLNENYVEDDDNMFRFDYSPEFLQWALQPPGWLAHWHCGVRVTKSGKLVGFISAIPTYVKIYSKRKNMVDINFLCVHKKLRSKRMTPVLIKEVTRRVHQEGLFQAVYTAGIVLPKPIACCRYWHRSLNPRKLIEVKFSHLSRNMTMQRTLKLYKLPEHPKTPGFRPFTPSDVKDSYKLMSIYLNKFDLSPIFSLDEFRHWFIPRTDIVNSFVVENNGVITDFVSFYTLPSTVMHHPVHKSLKAAYSFYNVSTRTPWVDLMSDTLVAAKNMGFDVFNALDLMENREFLEKLKFGIGDGNLQYYLYNWRCPAIDPKKMALVLQ